jgi:ribonuclease D
MPMTLQLPSPVIISSSQALRKLSRQLQDEPLIAVDTESNSLFAYYERVCLVQLSTRSQDWIVDPLAIPDMSPLGPLFADARIEKVFHAAEYDLMCLKRDYSFTFRNLFDTMISARIIGRKAIGLANMLEEFFGVQADKRFQRADWSVRPIPPEQLHYAQQDTHYLPALRDILLNLMQERGNLDEARDVFARLAEVPPAAHTFDPEGYWRINAARDFTRRQMAILRELYLLREDIAERRDRPPFKVASDEVLAGIVAAMPRNLTELGAVPGMSHGQVERYGNAILQAMQRGQRAKAPSRPDHNSRLDVVTMARYEALRDWRKTRAAERGVESDVIIPKEALWALARTPPRTLADLDSVPGLGPWKRDKYGAELIRLLAHITQDSADNAKMEQ